MKRRKKCFHKHHYITIDIDYTLEDLANILEMPFEYWFAFTKEQELIQGLGKVCCWSSIKFRQGEGHLELKFAVAPPFHSLAYVTNDNFDDCF